MAIKVKLRQKGIKGARKSLYLDFYPPIPHPDTGKPTRREFLGMYVFEKTKNPLDKKHNSETLRLAELIRQKRENQLNKPEIYSGYEREQLGLKAQGEKSFIDYYKYLTNKRKASNYDNWVSSLRYLDAFSGGELRFSDLNEKLCNDYRDYLLSTPSNRSSKKSLSQNSAASYFNKFKAALKQAYKDGLMANDLNSKVKAIKQAETRKEFLTLEELNLLAKTDCPNPLLKSAALFSALTGLRFSDIEKLIWSEVLHVRGEGHYINYQQKKTKGYELHPISDQAYQLMGESGELEQKVFEGLKYSAYQNSHLTKWVAKAGIKKNITFHCFRHTYATLQLSEGTDIYTVSKMLGHRELKTTQIYAKIVDQSKRDAADRIKLKLD